MDTLVYDTIDSVTSSVESTLQEEGCDLQSIRAAAVVIDSVTPLIDLYEVDYSKCELSCRPSAHGAPDHPNWLRVRVAGLNVMNYRRSPEMAEFLLQSKRQLADAYELAFNGSGSDHQWQTLLDVAHDAILLEKYAEAYTVIKQALKILYSVEATNRLHEYLGTQLCLDVKTWDGFAWTYGMYVEWCLRSDDDQDLCWISEEYDRRNKAFQEWHDEPGFDARLDIVNWLDDDVYPSFGI